MKKMLMLLGIVCGVVFLAGCGDTKVDENKSPEQIKQEVAKMDVSDIQKTVAAYQAEIAKKADALKVEGDKLSKIPLTQQFGDEAKGIRANMDTIKTSIDKLTKNLEAYQDGLKAAAK